MNRNFVIGVVTAALALCAGAADNQPHFRLALAYPSPAPAVPGRFRPSMSQSFYHAGRYDVRNATMVDLIRTAWGLDPDKVLGGPSWVEMDRFDISAVAPPDTSDAALKLMLRPLLEERFHLALHPDSRDFPTYALRAGKKAAFARSRWLGRIRLQAEAVDQRYRAKADYEWRLCFA
jgi:hypothetical protein